MDIYTLLIIGHLFGTVLGVGGATFIELNLSHALKDGKMDATDGGFMKIAFTTTRVGLVLALLTGFGFILIYIAQDQGFRLQNPVLWAKLLMVTLVAVNALLLQAHKVSLYWGSALSFVGWWATFVLGVFLTNNVRYSFITIMIAFAVAVVGGAYVLDVLRKRHREPAPTPQ